MARHWYHRVAVLGATQSGPWSEGRGCHKPLGHLIGQGVMHQEARFTPAQIDTGTWRLTRWGKRLETQARLFRETGVVRGA